MDTVMGNPDWGTVASHHIRRVANRSVFPLVRRAIVPALKSKKKGDLPVAPFPNGHPVPSYVL